MFLELHSTFMILIEMSVRPKYHIPEREEGRVVPDVVRVMIVMIAG